MSQEQTPPNTNALLAPGAMVGSGNAIFDRLLYLEPRAAVMATFIKVTEETVRELSNTWFGPDLQRFLMNSVIKANPTGSFLTEHSIEQHSSNYNTNPTVRDYLDDIGFRVFSKMALQNQNRKNLIEDIATGLLDTGLRNAESQVSEEILDRIITLDELKNLLDANRWFLILVTLNLLPPAVIFKVLVSIEETRVAFAKLESYKG